MKFFGLYLFSYLMQPTLSQMSIADEQARVIKIAQEYELFELRDISLLDILSEQLPDIFHDDLKSFSLGSLNEFGDEIILSQQAIASALKAFKVAAKENLSQIQFSIPQQIKIIAKPMKLTRRHIEQLLISHWSQICSDCRFTVTEMTEIKIQDSARWSIGTISQKPSSTFVLPVQIESSGPKPSSTIWVKGKVLIEKKLPEASEDLLAGSRIDESLIVWSWKPVESAFQTTPDPYQLKGSRLLKTIKKGQIIQLSHLQRELLVKRGSPTVSILRNNEWSISIPLVAEEDGFRGDLIQLKNPVTKAKIAGVVINYGEVEVQ